MGTRPGRYLAELMRVGHPPDRNPIAIAVCTSLAAILAPTAVGLRALPGSLAAAPDVFGQACAVVIVFACVAKVAGNFAPKRDAGLPWELLGSFVLAAGLTFYSVALIQSASSFSQAQIPFAMSVGLAVGSALRGAQIVLYARARASEAREG